MSESMVTIPLKEYEELKRIKETLKTKNFIVIKSECVATITIHTESEYMGIMANKLVEAGKICAYYASRLDAVRDGKVKPKDA